MDLPLDKYLARQFYETILWLRLSEQMLLLVLDLLNHLQERKPPASYEQGRNLERKAAHSANFDQARNTQS